MAKTDVKNALLSIRVPEKDLNKLKSRCAKIKRPYHEVVREIIVAFNEDRLTIRPNKATERLYELGK